MGTLLGSGMRRRTAAGLACAALLVASAARADPPSAPPSPAPRATPPAPSAPAPPKSAPAGIRSNDPDRVSGVVEPGSEPSDSFRIIASGILTPVREGVAFLFFAGEGIAGLVDNRQIVPRLSDTLAGRGGDLFLFPTVFAETGRGANIGARMIAAGRGAVTSVRVGFGGVHDLVAEGRVHVIGKRPLASALSLEAFFDQRSQLAFSGVGQVPGTDPRNHFTNPLRTGLYRQRRARAIASLGVRPSDDLEIFVASSLLRTHVEDEPGAGIFALSRAFELRDIAAALGTSTLLYGELSVRLDTRKNRGIPSPGFLVESYGGAARGIQGDAASFLRLGGRAGAFASILRPTNVLSPVLSLDGLVPIGQVPFTELPDAPEFRGAGERRDQVSLSGTLDYWWIFMRPFAARLFVDGTTLGGSLAKLDFAHPRVAAGFGLAVATRSAELGRLNLAFGTDGVRLTLSLGIDRGFGDRLHRD